MHDETLAPIGSSRGSKGMNLKGEGSVSAIGKCVSVLYDEGEPSLVSYSGVVVYLEHSRRVARPTHTIPPHSLRATCSAPCSAERVCGAMHARENLFPL